MELVEVKQEQHHFQIRSPPLLHDDFELQATFGGFFDDFTFSHGGGDDDYYSSSSLPPFPSFNHLFDLNSSTNILHQSSSSSISSSSCSSHIDHHDPVPNELGTPNKIVPTNGQVITREMLSRYFYMPITEAAKEMNMGLTLLKKRCRELGVRRWPHRKLMSLNTLISSVRHLLHNQQQGDDGHEGLTRLGKLEESVRVLEHERRVLEECPNLQLESNTKRLRQACFKANYKRKHKHGVSTKMIDHGDASGRRGHRRTNVDVQDVSSTTNSDVVANLGCENDDDGDEEIRSLLLPAEFDFEF